MNNKIIGNKGENIAREYLMSLGYYIVASNYQTARGEIDLIAKDDEILVFCEVKTRQNINYGYAHESVNYKKQEKIINTSIEYISENEIIDVQIRYDILEVYITRKIKINHIKNAFLLE